jgi:homoserine O-acetyltransferase
MPKPPASVGLVTRQSFTLPEPLALDSGETLHPVTLAYETYGALNADRSNAVLVLHALSGDAHAAGYHSPQDKHPGWWDDCIGPGKAFDTERYFVICSNVIGGCQGSTGPNSPNPRTGQPYGLSFPVVTIGDMVRAQRYLIDHLGIERLLAVAGGSMGGMQALQWAASYPERVRACLPIATTARHSPMLIAFGEVGRQAIFADPHWQNGAYYAGPRPNTGLALARMLGHITYLSEDSMHQKFGRRLQDREHFGYDFAADFAVESYLHYKGSRFTERFDANSYLYVTKALDYFDLANGHGNLARAFENSAQLSYLVVSFTSDWLYPSYHSKELVSALNAIGADVSYCNIQSTWGHDAFLLEVETMTRLIGDFLQRVAAEKAPASPVQAPAPASLRADLRAIAGLIGPGENVLDVGCGDGALLHYLSSALGCRTRGIELNEADLLACLQKGLSVCQNDLHAGLGDFPDQSFDSVVLTHWLAYQDDPAFVLREMRRVGRRALVTFPNAGHWRSRAELLVHGRTGAGRTRPAAPTAAPALAAWDVDPRPRTLTVADFLSFCQRAGLHVQAAVYLNGEQPLRPAWAPNLRATTALFVLE